MTFTAFLIATALTGLAAGPAATAGPNPAPPDAERAAAAFERFRELAGTWHASSTKGWDESVTYEVIAKGTAVLENSRFADDPAAGMVTLFHLDGDRLMLTHYCEAGNQPRMVATAIGPDAREVSFTLLDVTNLASPDAGHMAAAEYRFDGDGTFTARWSFVQGGEVVWAEDVRHERRDPGEAVAPAD